MLSLKMHTECFNIFQLHRKEKKEFEVENEEKKKFKRKNSLYSGIMVNFLLYVFMKDLHDNILFLS